MSSPSKPRQRWIHTLVILILLLTLGACSTGEESTGDAQDDSNLTSQGQALEGDNGSESDGGEPEPVALACPTEEVVYKLQFNHNWEFKPAGQGELMTVTGHTTPDAWCLVYSKGTTIEAEPCLIGYQYSGFIQGSDGKCSIEGASTALIEFEGQCMQPSASGGDVAELYLTIIETQDPDADLSGALNCKNYSGPYLGFYPPSHSTMNFAITKGGSTQTDNIDLTGQFTFNKTWTLIPSSMPEAP